MSAVIKDTFLEVLEFPSLPRYLKLAQEAISNSCCKLDPLGSKERRCETGIQILDLDRNRIIDHSWSHSYSLALHQQ